MGFNPHIVIQPNSFKIDKEFEKKLKYQFKEIKVTNTFFGEGIVVNEDNAKGVIIKGIDVESIDNYNFLLNQNPTNDLKKLERKLLL